MPRAPSQWSMYTAVSRMAHRMSGGLERAAGQAAATLRHEAPELLLLHDLLDGAPDHFCLSLHAEHALGAAQGLRLDEERFPDQGNRARHRFKTSVLQHSIGIHL